MLTKSNRIQSPSYTTCIMYLISQYQISIKINTLLAWVIRDFPQRNHVINLLSVEEAMRELVSLGFDKMRPDRWSYAFLPRLREAMSCVCCGFFAWKLFFNPCNDTAETHFHQTLQGRCGCQDATPTRYATVCASPISVKGPR